ncbi:hypothetical protein TNCV_1126111 [Trichonephila clavipes]|nr:hypothetical protein TNCV_1126111 [Trichonephila clavipes]
MANNVRQTSTTIPICTEMAFGEIKGTEGGGGKKKNKIQTTHEQPDENICSKQRRKTGIGDRLTNTFTKDFCVRITNTFKKDFLCLDNEHIFGGDQGYTPEIMDEILITARDLELEENEDDIEELIMGHEDELTTEELQEILNEEHQETQRNVSPSEQEEDERGPMPTSAIKDLLKKWADVRAMVLEWHPNQADVSRVGDLLCY